MKVLAYDFLVYEVRQLQRQSCGGGEQLQRQLPGKADEFGDVENNRANFHILSASFTPATIAFDNNLTKGSVEGPCHFEDIPGPGHDNAGKRQFVSGTCLLTTVYEDFRWYLCDSHFNAAQHDAGEPSRARTGKAV